MKRARPIFHAALELEDDHRSQFLDAACKGDDELRHMVDSLLAANEEADQFMEEAAVSTADTAIQHPDETGRRIDRYKLLQKIGEGGFGVVYMAEQQEPVVRRVALKIIKPGMDTKQVIARFEAERQALALMEHPHIAQVFDAGETENGRPYFVMELVRGVPIVEFCDEQRLNNQRRLELFQDVCEAVQHAHQKGVIHRDLKPSNVLVTMQNGEPVPKVIDFGVAKATQQRLTDKTLFTRFEQFIGTPAYMSPEQAQMSSLDVDTRSDIYSLGVLLYELLTGTTPLNVKQALQVGFEELRRRIREEEFPRPSKRVSSLELERRTTLASSRGLNADSFPTGLRGDLDWIVMKAVDKDRRRRYESASAFAADVKRFLRQEPVSAAPPSTRYRLSRFVRRNRAAVATTAIVAASLIVGTVTATVGMVRAWDEAAQTAIAKADLADQVTETQSALSAAEAEKERALAAEKDAVVTTYFADIFIGHTAADMYNLGLARRMRDKTRHFGVHHDPRGWEWRALWLRCLGNSEKHFSFGQNINVWSVATSHDGEWVAAHVKHRGVTIWNVQSDDAEKTFLTMPPGGPDAPFAFSPTENVIYGITDNGELGTWQIPSLVKKGARFKTDGRIEKFCISSDGNSLATWDSQGILTTWNVETREEENTRLLAGIPRRILAMSADGSKLAFTEQGANQGKVNITIVDALTLDDPVVIGFGPHPHDLKFSPNGQWIAAVRGLVNKPIMVWRVSDGEVVAELNGHELLVHTIEFSPDGRFLASAGRDQTVRLWDTSTWRQASVLPGHNGTVNDLAFSPDGNKLFSAGLGEVHVWHPHVAAGAKWPVSEEVLTKSDYESPYASVTFSLDSKLLATRDEGTGVSLRSAETLEVVRKMTEADGDVRGVRFSPTENLLAVGYMDGSLALFDVEKQQELKRFTVFADAHICPVRYSNDGKRLLVVARKGKAKWCAVYSIDDLRTIAAWPVPQDTADILAVLSADGRTAVTGGANTVTTLWPVDDVDNPTVFTAAGSYTVDISPDGKYLLREGGLGQVAIVDIGTGEVVDYLVGHRTPLSSARFSPDGSRVATGGHENESVKIWDFATRRELLTLKTQGWYHRQVEWSPDGNAIALVGGDGRLSLWRVPSMEEIAAAEAREQTRRKLPDS